ncbi:MULTISPECIES: ABC transporter permease [Winslowiella]|uniref:ABC transporter permease n=1 Tax=Winslowiella TaxID=2997349 RepID=UPI0028BDFDB3|nr:ABC transporter permease [Winslowiella toletana]WNN45949.1 ABC transporter permease [Winslowiella toletana]
MNIGMILTSIAVLMILCFLMYSVLFTAQDTKFAFLNLFRHKRRSFSTIFAIILGGVAIFLYGGFIDYSFWILKQQTVRTNIGHIQIYDKSYFETSNKSKSIINNYQGLKADIIHDPELSKYISTISGQLEFTGVISQYEHETSSYFSALGVEPLPALKLGSFDKLVSGSDLSRIKHDEITLGSGLANTLSARYADWVDLLVVNSHGGQGALSLKVRGIFSSGIKDYDDVAMKMPLQTAQRVMATDGVSKFVILLKDDRQLDEFSIKLEKFIADKQLPLIVKNWKELSIFYQQVEGLLSGIYFFIKVIVALIVIFMIGNSMSMNILERTREITTLRAIGLRPAHVSRLFLLEGIFIGAIGAIGSLIIGFALAGIINLKGIAMPPSPGQSQGYNAFIKTDNFDLYWITLVLPILTASLASILPALKASRLNISDAFKSV